MAYRSTIAIAVYGNKGKLTELKSYYLREVEKLNDPDVIDDLNTMISASINHTGKPIWDDESGEFFFYATRVIWWPRYPTVSLFDGIFEKSQELGLYAESIRIGDELKDIEVHYADGDAECERRLKVSRAILF
jgi:hypothetical protein